MGSDEMSQNLGQPTCRKYTVGEFVCRAVGRFHDSIFNLPSFFVFNRAWIRPNVYEASHPSTEMASEYRSRDCHRKNCDETSTCLSFPLFYFLDFSPYTFSHAINLPLFMRERRPTRDRGIRGSREGSIGTEEGVTGERMWPFEFTAAPGVAWVSSRAFCVVSGRLAHVFMFVFSWCSEAMCF